jgi:hypothetical protein
MLAANIIYSQPSLLLLDHPDFLRLGETAFPHASAASGLGRLYIKVRRFLGGRSGRSRTAQQIADAPANPERHRKSRTARPLREIQAFGGP